MALWVREAHRALTDEEVHSVLVPVEERWDAHDHLEDQDTERPPVHCEVVSIADEHLRGQVLGCTAEGVGQLTLLNELGEAEVSNKKVSYRRNKKPGWPLIVHFVKGCHIDAYIQHALWKYQASNCVNYDLPSSPTRTFSGFRSR